MLEWMGGGSHWTKGMREEFDGERGEREGKLVEEGILYRGVNSECWIARLGWAAIHWAQKGYSIERCSEWNEPEAGYAF